MNQRTNTNMTDTNMPRSTVFLPNLETYDKWSHTYDTDGNILQAIDTLALQQLLLANFLHTLTSSSTDDGAGAPESASQVRRNPLRLIDLGCGTGRAILTLLGSLDPTFGSSSSSSSSSSDEKQAGVQAAFGDLCRSIENDGRADLQILGLDASSGMLSVARSRVPQTMTLAKPCPGTTSTVSTQFAQWDANSPSFHVNPAHAVMSTLVMEHLDLPTYFLQLKKCLLPGGIALVTNMHPDMGNVIPATPDKHVDSAQAQESSRLTGAGFVDQATGQKIRAAVDYVHTISDVLKAAHDAGFGLVDKVVRECKVEQWMLRPDRLTGAPLLGDRGHKWLGVNVWFGMILRKGHLSHSRVETLHSIRKGALYKNRDVLLHKLDEDAIHGARVVSLFETDSATTA